MTLGRDRVAQALPNYVIGEEVGRGAWGVVIKGEHRRLGRKVAIKELPQAFAADPGVQHRFASEARLLASLDHPHIVPIFDYVEEDQLCLLVMELLPGGTVWDRVTTEGVSPETACSIVLATCSALHYAHGKGILHRDIKPENLLFGSSGVLKVTDFGIAKVLGGVETFATRTGEVLGTPAYIAPEQALARELTPATDVYAVGTLLYELLSSRLPFADDGNAIALLYRHVHEPPTPLLDVAPSVPRPIAEVTMKALATDPADRHPTAEEFGAVVAEAASTGWGSDWVRRAGLSVMASGEIAARISGGARLWEAATDPHGRTTPAGPGQRAMEAAGPGDQPTPTPALEGAVPPDIPAAQPADAQAAQPAATSPTIGEQPPRPAAPTGSPRARATHSGSPDPVKVDTTRPEDLVAVQNMLPERLSDLRQTTPDSKVTVPKPASTAPATPPGAGQPAEVMTPGRSGRRLVVLGGAVFLVVVAVVAVVVLLGSGGRKSPGSTTPSSVASPPGRAVFSDDFSNPQSGWAPDSNQDDNGTASYANGGYQVTALKPNAPLNTFSVSSPFTTRLTSIASQVNAAILTGSPADGAGVRCDQGSRNGLRYTLQANGDGTWVIFKLGTPEQSLLAQGRSSSIHTGPGQSANTITGQCTEVSNGTTRLVMAVNGIEVGSATDAHGGSPIPWHAALAVYRSQSSPTTEVRFTDFRSFDTSGS